MNNDYASIIKLIDDLDKQSATDQIYTAIEAISKYQPDPIEQEKILHALAKKIGVGVKAVKNTYQQVCKQLNLEHDDVGYALAKETLNSFYDKGHTICRMPDGKYYVFDQTHWRTSTQDQVRSNIQQIAGKYLAYAENRTLRALVSDALGCLNDLLGTDQDVLNFMEELPPIINCKNGELFIKPSGAVELCPHRPESRLFYCLPFDYDPKATCPVYDQTIGEIFSETSDPADMARHFNEFMGYAIQPQRFIASFWMLIGHGRNGKSKLMETIQRLIGPSAVLNDQLSTFQQDQFNAAALLGKLVFFDDDLNSKVVLNDGLLKKISEAKLLSARHPYGKTKFNFLCVALPIMAGNHYPLCKDLSEGMRRRINILPFDRQFTLEEADPQLFPNIWKNEMSGVLNRALEGLCRVMKRKAFKPPVDCYDAVETFLAHSNPLYCFVEEQLQKNSKGRIKLQEFRAMFEIWAGKQGFSKTPVLDKRLKRQLEGLGFEFVLNDGLNAIKGWSLKNLSEAA